MSIYDASVFAEKAEVVLGCAKKLGADEAVVQLGQSEGQSLQLREGEMEALKREQSCHVGITVYKDQSRGYCSLSDWSSRALKDGVRAALNGARYTEPDQYYGLPEIELYQDVANFDFDALDIDSGKTVDTSWLEKQIREMEIIAKAEDARIVMSNGVNADAMRGYSYLATSNGFRGGYGSTRFDLSIALLARENDDQQSNYGWDSARYHGDLRSVSSIAQEAVSRTVASLQPQKIVSGHYPVIFAPEVSAGLLGTLVQALSGTQQYRQLSFLTDSLGEKVLPDWLNLLECPFLTRGLNSRAFDSEGLVPSQAALIEDGRVARYVLNTYTAKRLNLTPTGNAGGVRNLYIINEKNKLSPQEMYTKMGRGLVVNSLMGQGMNLLTGDYSRGASGFWVDGGKIAHPVDGLTVAGNLRDMFAGIVATGDDEDIRGRIHAPSLWVEQMAVAQ